ncbi:SMP-30/gluconolactonase/LRE family protein [Telluria beijingensis]|uniref:SMP-30/gluconolactonase/LRE family protein n=1 Tax=Telluria beijingensis TaxID=3068633 RepID=UPI00279564A4|nr:SMP-30/gluconolactonase/LRE family protein [Massilia sp. REN29]
MTRPSRPAPISLFLGRALLAAGVAAALPAGALAATCGGKPPSGELKAERIAAIKPSRSEPGLYEGPVWIKDALYFSDFSFGEGFPSRVRKFSPDGAVSTALEDAGSNGLAVDASGALVAATHKYKAMSRYDLASGKRASIATRYQGQVFNSPNDIAIAADGTIYFTDPDYQKAAAPGGQPVTGIYRIATDGTVTLVDGTRKNPNGIALSLNGDILYVNASDGAVRAYPIKNGVPQQGHDLIKGIENGDGMTLDCHGNLYVTEHGPKRVRVFTPQGRELATIRVDANVTNVAFGGADGKTLYITGAGAVWQLRLDVTGLPY